MTRFRFSLAFLLSLTALLAALLGYANYRRSFLHREANALGATGILPVQKRVHARHDGQGPRTLAAPG